MNKIDEIITRGVANIIPGEAQLRSLLESGRILNIYQGIDPTANKIHLGHAVPLRKLQALVELGHHVTFLIGDFTALIGDTSDKDSERPVLTTAQIEENFRTYKSQAEKFLDFSKIEIRHNSEWLSKLSFAEIVKLCQHFSVGDFISRELIKKRLGEGRRVGLHELIYPIMQGFDSYTLDTDIQIGGTDQTFNMQAGRTLQKDLRNKDSLIMSNALLEGTDGRKMSKSWGNAIWLEDSPTDVFGKVMSISDDLIIQYFTLATNIDLDEVSSIEVELKSGLRNPMDTKKLLAHTIVSELHSATSAAKAQADFEAIFQGKGVPEDIKEISIANSTRLSEILCSNGLVSSNSEFKRLISEKGIRINGQVVTDPLIEMVPKQESVIKIGKLRFLKIINK